MALAYTDCPLQKSKIFRTAVSTLAEQSPSSATNARYPQGAAIRGRRAHRLASTPSQTAQTDPKRTNPKSRRQGSPFWQVGDAQDSVWVSTHLIGRQLQT
jgi:hypothetical protein